MRGAPLSHIERNYEYVGSGVTNIARAWRSILLYEKGIVWSCAGFAPQNFGPRTKRGTGPVTITSSACGIAARNFQPGQETESTRGAPSSPTGGPGSAPGLFSRCYARCPLGYRAAKTKAGAAGETAPSPIRAYTAGRSFLYEADSSWNVAESRVKQGVQG